MGCVLEHCSLCFPCYLQNPPLSTGGEIKRVFIRAQAALDTTLRPEPRPTQWLIEHGSPSVCSGHTTPEPWTLQNAHMSSRVSRAAKALRSPTLTTPCLFKPVGTQGSRPRGQLLPLRGEMGRDAFSHMLTGGTEGAGAACK